MNSLHKYFVQCALLLTNNVLSGPGVWLTCDLFPVLPEQVAYVY